MEVLKVSYVKLHQFQWGKHQNFYQEKSNGRQYKQQHRRINIFIIHILLLKAEMTWQSSAELKTIEMQ